MLDWLAGSAGQDAHRKRCAEEGDVARILLRAGYALPIGIGGGGASVGIVPHADGAGSEPDRLAGTQRRSAFQHDRIDAERLDHRGVIGRVSDRRNAEEDEIAIGRRGIAIELREVRW